MLNGKTILITGGTGSFGQKFVEILVSQASPKKLIIFSRDELKQFEMRERFSEKNHPFIRYFIGDTRDRDRLYRAFDGVDIVIHAAALKQIPSCEYNPLEAVKTNVMGAANIIDAAIDMKVDKLIALSTDKAVNPANLYGATKLCSDKLFVSANNYSGTSGTKFGVVRYGNVIGSRGSVVPVFIKARKTGKLPITDARMTRYWITLEQSVEFVFDCLKKICGGEIFVPKLPSMKIVDLAKAVSPNAELINVGIRPGEKLHEVMVSEDDARHTLDFGDYYVILPPMQSPALKKLLSRGDGSQCPEGFQYCSSTNDDWLSVNDLKRMIHQFDSSFFAQTT